jgi:hypothetical protein
VYVAFDLALILAFAGILALRFRRWRRGRALDDHYLQEGLASRLSSLFDALAVEAVMDDDPGTSV